MAKARSGLAEIEARYRKELQARKAELQAEIADIDAKLKALGVKTRRPRKARKAPVRKPGPRTGKPLRIYVEEALAKAKSPMKVREIEAAVKRAGYKTLAKNFYHSLYALLRQDPRIQKAGRGTFALKKASKPRSKRKAKKAKT